MVLRIEGRSERVTLTLTAAPMIIGRAAAERVPQRLVEMLAADTAISRSSFRAVVQRGEELCLLS